MPELPEVETVKRGLQKLLPGRIISGLSFDWDKSFPNARTDVEQFLIGAKILEVKRRAKVLLIELSSKYSLVIHLKMTGQLVFVGKERFGAGHPNDSLIGNLPDKSTRVIFYLSDYKYNASKSSVKKQRSVQNQERWQSFGETPEADQRGEVLFFNDQRKFGWVRLIPTLEVPNINFFKKVGPEPLSEDFTTADFATRLKRRSNTTIKAAILDQTVLAGIGNIYADEALFTARIHPVTKVKDVSAVKRNRLFLAIKAVLQLSIDKGGSSDRNYVNAEGGRGSYLGFAKVFRREGQACERCGHTIIKIRVAGRGTHICPHCQKPLKEKS